MTAETAGRIYDVLVECVGAPESAGSREDFAQSMSRPDAPSEYRFQGALGMGGKFRVARHNPTRRPDRYWYVDYYPENRTVDRDRMVEAANARLMALREELQGEVEWD